MQTLFLVFYRIDYEGIYEGDMAIFSTRDNADKYANVLKQRHGVGMGKVVVREIIVDTVPG